VRLRIVHALSGDRTRTTAELCASIPGVSKATIYRQVGLLLRGGLLEVAGERQAHGAIERRYRMRGEQGIVGREEAASMSLDDHRAGFAAAIAALAADFDAYLDRTDANPVSDLVSYIQAPLWLNRDELRALLAGVHRTMMEAKNDGPAPDRRLYLFSPILFPIESPPPATAEDEVRQ
jgi:hypothetical protein